MLMAGPLQQSLPCTQSVPPLAPCRSLCQGRHSRSTVHVVAEDWPKRPSAPAESRSMRLTCKAAQSSSTSAVRSEDLVRSCTEEVGGSAPQQHQQHSRPARRTFVHQLLLGAAAASSSLSHTRPASAALLQLPATELNNEYYLVRAGESEAEAQGYTLTNPVAKTNMQSGLSRRGKKQVVKGTAVALESMGACVSGCWLWPSITQRCYQTAEILAALLDISRSRIVPEYSFLDPRGVGAMEGLPIPSVEQQMLEGDLVSADWRPPHGTDGTPHESIVDVLIRLRQVLSITETQYRDTSIIIISPDSDNLSVIQAALVGADLRSHKQFAFQPGEVRILQTASAREEDFFSPRKFTCANPPLCK